MLTVGCLATPADAGVGAVIDSMRPPVPQTGNDTWVVSSRHAPPVLGCCETIRKDRCPLPFQAHAGYLEVYHRDGCGCLRRRSMADLLASLDPTVPTVVFTHGSFITFDYFVTESPRTATVLEQAAGRRINVVFFSWPSDGCIPACAAAVRIRERRARTYSFYLLELLRRLPPEGPGKPTIIASHSHGGEMLSATLHLLAGGAIGRRRAANPPPVRPRALLFAPAVDANDYNPGQAFDRALMATPAMAVVYSRQDIANMLYPLRRPLARASLGHTGLRRKDAIKIGPLAGRVSNMDVTSMIDVRHVWSEYLDHPQILCALRSYFQ